MSSNNINIVKKIDIKELGWFWAVSRHEEAKYYKKHYFYNYAPDDRKEYLLSPKHLGEVIMLEFLSQRPYLLGMLIRNYFTDRMLTEHTVFNVPLLEYTRHPHDIYEYIWAAFKTHMFSVKEIMTLFDISDQEVRDAYNSFDLEFEEKPPKKSKKVKKNA